MCKIGDENQPIYICPGCGEIASACNMRSQCCYCELTPDKYIKTNYIGDIYNQMSRSQAREWEEMLRKRYVLTLDNPYYNKEAYYEREDADFRSNLELENFEKKREAQRQQITSAQTTITCPKCGSTNFTPVRRKWSFLTGFMTNKVDMVCNGCGWVKKG